MEYVEIKEMKICGLEIQTDNATEFSGAGKIMGLWDGFRKISMNSNMQNIVPVGVYFNYENEDNSSYKLIAGVASDLENIPSEFSKTVVIKSGKYLKFSATGQLPEIVVKLWGEVWGYFSSPNCEYKRKFTTDFEEYKTHDSVDIYISIN